MRISFVFLGAMALTACATPHLVHEDRRNREITLHEPIDQNSYRIWPQTFRLTFENEKYLYFVGDLGASTWPHQNGPNIKSGLCLKKNDPEFVGFYTQNIGMSVCNKAKKPPELTHSFSN